MLGWSRVLFLISIAIKAKEGQSNLIKDLQQLSTSMTAKINRCENMDQVLFLLFQNSQDSVKKAG